MSSKDECSSLFCHAISDEEEKIFKQCDLSSSAEAFINYLPDTLEPSGACIVKLFTAVINSVK